MVTAPILLRVLVAFAVAVAGGALSAFLARTHKQLCALISLGAGTLLGTAVFAIVPECLEALRWWQFLIAGARVTGLFALISKYVFHVCPACAAVFDEATTHHFGEIAIPMMVAWRFHCTVDGLALAAGHEEQVPPGARTWLDVSITFAMCVHRLPEGLALGALLLGAAFPRGRMLWLVAAVESTTVSAAFSVGLFFRRSLMCGLPWRSAHAEGGPVGARGYR